MRTLETPFVENRCDVGAGARQGLRHGDKLTGCTLGTPVPVTEDTDYKNINYRQVVETIPAIHQSLNHKQCAYIDAAESRNCIALGQIGQHMVNKPTPQQV